MSTSETASIIPFPGNPQREIDSQRSFEDVLDPDLKACLGRAELVMDRIDIWPYRVTWVQNSREFADVLGVTKDKLNLLLDEVRRNNIVDTPVNAINYSWHTVHVPAFDKDHLRAFTAVAWAGKDTRFVPEIAVVVAREGLGPNYLAGLIHDAGSQRVAMPSAPEPETPDAPETSENETLEEFLDRFRKKLPMDTPLHTESIASDSAVKEALGLKSVDTLFLMHGVRAGGREDSQLIDPKTQPSNGPRPMKFYDDVRMDALAAIAWSMKQVLAPPYHLNWKNVDWQAIARHARDELMLIEPLAADHIHVRGEATPIPSDIQSSPMSEAIAGDLQAGEELALAIDTEAPEIEDKEFRHKLQRIDRDIEKIDLWPFPLAAVAELFPDIVRKNDKMRFDRRVESAWRVITFSEDGTKLDRDELRAFLLFYYSYDAWTVQLPVQTRVDKLRTALGKHPLAEVIHAPTNPAKKAEKSPSGGISGSKGKTSTSKEPPGLMSRERILQILEGMSWGDLMGVKDKVASIVDENAHADHFYEPIEFGRMDDRFIAAAQLVLRAKSVWEKTQFDPSLRGLDYRKLRDAYLQLESNFADSPQVWGVNGKQLWQLFDNIEKQQAGQKK